MDVARSPLVLVVDDDWRTARVLVKMLREDGFDAELVTDGARAINRLSKSPHPDALVTDLWLSHADGAAVARFGRSLCPNLAVIVVANDRHRAAALAGALDPPARVLAKPIDYDVLRAELGAAIARIAELSAPSAPTAHSVRRPPGARGFAAELPRLARRLLSRAQRCTR